MLARLWCLHGKIKCHHAFDSLKGNANTPVRHAIANTLAGVVIFFIIAASFLQYTGAWYGKYLPMSDSNVYDNTGKTYDVSRVLSKDFTLDEGAYNTYSPLFLRYVAPPPFGGDSTYSCLLT